jgi:hypothetical protein
MTTSVQWRKSSYSGGGEGNDCVEIANLHTQIAIRDSKDPSRGVLSFPAEPFTALIKALQTDTSHPSA